MAEASIKTMSRASALRAQAPAAFAYEGGVDRFVEQFAKASPLEIVHVERTGVSAALLKDLGQRMNIPNKRMFEIVGVPKATAEKKAASGAKVLGSGAQATLGLVRLLAIVNEMLAASTHCAAGDFDAALWLGEWIERPQAALAGQRPADLLDTPTGVQLVAHVLGSMQSGAYL
jgi:putative toxin-antitoxin system antitoxin component (TIGR02293 family)